MAGLTHIQRAQRSSSVFLACACRAHRVWPCINSSLHIPSSFLLRHSWMITYIPADRISKNYLRRWMIPTCCEYNTKSRFSNISRTSWNWHFTKSMSSGEGESEKVIGGSGSDRRSVGDDSLACMTSYLWNSEMKTRHLSRTSCGCPRDVRRATNQNGSEDRQAEYKLQKGPRHWSETCPHSAASCHVSLNVLWVEGASQYHIPAHPKSVPGHHR